MRELKEKLAIRSRSNSGRISVSEKNQGQITVQRIDKLQADLKDSVERCGSIQRQLDLVVQNRDEMADQLVKLSNDSQMYQTEARECKQALANMQDLEVRYSTVLVLLGEKTERVTELEADVVDMKTAFKDQLLAMMNK